MSPLRLSLHRLRSLLSSFLKREVAYTTLEEVAPPGTIATLLPELEVPTPETANMEIEPVNGHLSGPVYTAPRVRTALVSGLRYCPTNHCLLTSGGAVVLESTGPGARPVPLDTSALRQPTERIEGIAVPLRCFFNDFYHLLVDNLSRVDLLNLPHFRSFPNISLLCPNGLTKLEAYFVERLLPSNVTVCPVAPGVLYRPDRMLVNTFITCRASGYLRGPFIPRLRRHFDIPDTLPSLPKRIFISRRRAAKGRHVLNEEALLSRLRPLGFQAFVLEEMPIEEQIGLFRRAEVVVGAHGAGLSHLLFAPSTRVLELFATRFVVPHYFLLAKSLGHRYSYLTGSESHQDANFTVDVKQVEHHVRELLTAASSIGIPSANPNPTF